MSLFFLIVLYACENTNSIKIEGTFFNSPKAVIPFGEESLLIIGADENIQALSINPLELEWTIDIPDIVNSYNVYDNVLYLHLTGETKPQQILAINLLMGEIIWQKKIDTFNSRSKPIFYFKNNLLIFLNEFVNGFEALEIEINTGSVTNHIFTDTISIPMEVAHHSLLNNGGVRSVDNIYLFEDLSEGKVHLNGTELIKKIKGQIIWVREIDYFYGGNADYYFIGSKGNSGFHNNNFQVINKISGSEVFSVDVSIDAQVVFNDSWLYIIDWKKSKTQKNSSLYNLQNGEVIWETAVSGIMTATVFQDYLILLNNKNELQIVNINEL